MATLTLDRVLAQVEALPEEERAMLEKLLLQRRVEAWRRDTAIDAKKAARAFRTGKLKSQPAQKVIARLRAAK
jgi:hypothetical protein